MFSMPLRTQRFRKARPAHRGFAFFTALLLCALLFNTAGCGNGGYPGGGLTTLSKSSITIDSGQSFTFTTSVSGGGTVNWALAGTNCSGSACGSLSTSSGASVVYTAPTGLSSQITMTLTGSLAGTSSTQKASITVNPAPVIGTSAPAATVGTAYTYTVPVTGGTTPLTWSVAGGALPDGLTFNTSTGVISGTPTVSGSATLTLKVTDASDVPYSTTAPQTVVVATSGTPLALSGSLPNGTVGAAYAATLVATGGTSPYSYALVSGSLPVGLSLSTSGVLSGTPTTAATSTFSVKVTDAKGSTVTANYTVTIANSSGNLTLTTTGLPDGTVGTPYTATIGASGGTAPYSCVIVSGNLPAGLTLSGCIVSGTPTVAGTGYLSVKVTDSAATPNTVTGPVTLTIKPANSVIMIADPPTATLNVPYTGTIGVTGGTSPYTCTVTAGTLPAGLSISNCTISGTPTVAGAQTLTVQVTDSSSPALSTTGSVVVTVTGTTGSLTISAPANATVGQAYTGTIGVTGGKSPYTCVQQSGTLPAGLSISNCTISGTPTTAGASTINVKVTDSTTPTAITTSGPVTITVVAPQPLTLTGSLPNAIVNQSYSQKLEAKGGISPYTYAITAGTLPSGITLATDGTLSGTPTAVGAYSFTVTATDSTAGTAQTASLPLVLLVTYAPTNKDALLKGPYAFLFQGYDDVLVGVLAYKTASAGSMTADGAGVITAGVQDENHQSSNPTGNTITRQTVIGTYTVGDDLRGSLTLTTFKDDGTVDATATYAISVKAPATGVTTASQVSLIRADGNGLVGIRGSGQMLQQTSSALLSGLSGSYVFGVEGDTPCLLSCTIGLIGGPAAAVGQISTATGGSITGTSDSMIASTSNANASLTGAYTAADGNGRVGLTLTMSGAASAYPSDYAVYVVDGNNAIVLSTDKHSSYVLLSGTMQKQTQATFSNASLNGGYVGYENAMSNPGLLGTVLSNVLNFSTATIFRGTGSGSGTCDTTNLDTAGLTGLLNQLTGLGGSSQLLNALLGTYQTTGTANCTVASNGRGQLNYPAPGLSLSTILQLLGLGSSAPSARTVYLSAPNTGYFLETSYAGLGHLEAQTGGPFSVASFKGTFVYGTEPAASLASINASGTATANGTGTLNFTSDLNVGVGNLNVIQLGTTSSSTYSLTDAAAGRYTSGTLVIYAISPTKYVLVDTNILTTSPTVGLLY